MAKATITAEAFLTQARLFELLSYDPAKGDFTNLKSRGGLRVGAKAGAVAHHGYIHIVIDRRMYLGHRLAWFYMTGKWPDAQIDHRNMVRGDNRWSNLRAATQSQQQQNQRVRKDNRLGIKGVKVLPSGKFRADIKADGVRHCLGRTFPTAGAAHSAYLEAKRRLHTFQPTIPE